jgi:hypothetical protein
VFSHVGSERILVGHDLVADAAGRVAQVDLKVGIAALHEPVRPLAHAANKTAILF